MPAEDAGQDPVTFEDVAIRFSPEEWAMLTVQQRGLYREVMEDNFELVASLESQRPPKPELLCKMEKGEELHAFDQPGQEEDTGFGPALSATWSWKIQEPTNEEFGGRWNPLVSLESIPGLGLGVHPVKACPSSWTDSKPPAVKSTLQGPREWGEGGDSLGRASLDQIMLQICECGRSFEDSESLHEHQAFHKEEKGPFVCMSCGKWFQYHLNLLTHKKHRGKRRYACAPCGIQFCLKGDMLRHRPSHALVGLYACAVCNLLFRRKRHLLAHNTEHGVNGTHKCPTCGTAFDSEAELLGHQLSHQEEKPFLCSKCGESFSWKESLQVHQRTHAHDRALSCHLFGKTFSRHGNLLTQQRVHAGGLPFPCPECEHSFSSKANLMVHRKQHKWKKPFACPQCGRGFRFRDKLLEHQASHSTEEGR